MVQILASFILFLYLCGIKVQHQNYEKVSSLNNDGNNDSAYSKRYQAD